MKLFRILFILLLLTTSLSTQGYNLSNNTYRSTSIYISQSSRDQIPQSDQYRVPKIGYSTDRYNRNFYSSTDSYYPRGCGETRGNRGPNKMIVYHADGSTSDTGNDTRGNPTRGMWDTNYDYYWDGTNWWRRPINGGAWEKWETIFGWGLTGWGWNTHSWFGFNEHKPDENILNRAYEENPVPIEDPEIELVIGLALLYIGYNTIVRPRLKKR